jgi:hypothetical protein
MGASFNYRLFGDFLDRKTIAKMWDDMCEQSRHDRGHSYSGDIGMLRGNVQWHEEVLPAQHLAYEFVLQNHKEKWDPPVAAPYVNETGHKIWLIGGWCSE